MSPSLSGLPVELLGKIAEAVSGEGRRHLRNLRLTCRAIHAKTMFEFASVHYKTMTLERFPGSFPRLWHVCQHSGLRSHVRTIIIKTDFLVCRDGYNPMTSSLTPIESVPTPDFDQKNLDYILNKNFAGPLSQCLRLLVNLERIRILQYKFVGDLTEIQAAMLQRAFSRMIAATLYIVQAYGIHLKGFEIHDPGSRNFPAYLSALEPMSWRPGLLDLITDLRLEFGLGCNICKNNCTISL